MKFAHVSIVARDTDRLAGFYSAVFECAENGARRTLSGAQISRGNGLPGSEIYAAWLGLPGVEGPFLEIHQYGNTLGRPIPPVNQPGYGHIAFLVDDIHATIEAILEAGGQSLGKVTDLGTADAPVLCVYMRDPGGNIVELEQR